MKFVEKAIMRTFFMLTEENLNLAQNETKLIVITSAGNDFSSKNMCIYKNDAHSSGRNDRGLITLRAPPDLEHQSLLLFLQEAQQTICSVLFEKYSEEMNATWREVANFILNQYETVVKGGNVVMRPTTIGALRAHLWSQPKSWEKEKQISVFRSPTPKQVFEELGDTAFDETILNGGEVWVKYLLSKLLDTYNKNVKDLAFEDLSTDFPVGTSFVQQFFRFTPPGLGNTDENPLVCKAVAVQQLINGSSGSRLR